MAVNILKPSTWFPKQEVTITTIPAKEPTPKESAPKITATSASKQTSTNFLPGGVYATPSGPVSVAPGSVPPSGSIPITKFPSSGGGGSNIIINPSSPTGYSDISGQPVSVAPSAAAKIISQQNIQQQIAIKQQQAFMQQEKTKQQLFSQQQIQPYLYQKQIDTFISPEGRAIPIYQTYYVDENKKERLATAEEQEYYSSHPTEQNILQARTTPIKLPEKIYEQAIKPTYEKIKGYYTSAETEASKRTVKPIIEATKIREIITAEPDTGLIGLQKGFTLGILKDIEEEPIKQVALVGIGYGIGKAVSGGEYIAAKIGIGKVGGIGAKVVVAGLTGLYAYDVGTQIYYSKDVAEIEEHIGVAAKDIFLLGVGGKAAQPKKIAIEDLETIKIYQKEGKIPYKSPAEEFAGEPVVFYKEEKLGRKMIISKDYAKANLPEEPIKFVFEPTFEQQRQITRLNKDLDILELIKTKEGIKFKIREAPKPESLLYFDREPINIKVSGEFTLYHGTTDKAINDILKEGLKPAIKTGKSPGIAELPKEVFLTEDIEAAKGYAARAAVKLGGEPRIVEVRIPIEELKGKTFGTLGEISVKEVPKERISIYKGYPEIREAPAIPKVKINKPIEFEIKPTFEQQRQITRLNKELDVLEYTQGKFKIREAPAPESLKVLNEIRNVEVIVPKIDIQKTALEKFKKAEIISKDILSEKIPKLKTIKVYRDFDEEVSLGEKVIESGKQKQIQILKEPIQKEKIIQPITKEKLFQASMDIEKIPLKLKTEQEFIKSERKLLFGIPSFEKEKQQVKQKQVQYVKQVSIINQEFIQPSATIQKTKQVFAFAQPQAQPQAQAQATKQLQRQIYGFAQPQPQIQKRSQRQRQSYTFKDPQMLREDYLIKTPQRKKPALQSKYSTERAISKELGYDVFKIKKGKPVVVAKGLYKSAALDIGTEITLKDLTATFGIRPSDISPRDIATRQEFRRFGSLFREPTLKSKYRKYGQVYVQRQRRTDIGTGRLTFLGEKKAIQSARMKKIMEAIA